MKDLDVHDTGKLRNYVRIEFIIFEELFVKVGQRITVHFTKFRYLYYLQLCVYVQGATDGLKALPSLGTRNKCCTACCRPNSTTLICCTASQVLARAGPTANWGLVLPEPDLLFIEQYFAIGNIQCGALLLALAITVSIVLHLPSSCSRATTLYSFILSLIRRSCSDVTLLSLSTRLPTES